MTRPPRWKDYLLVALLLGMYAHTQAHLVPRTTSVHDDSWSAKTTTTSHVSPYMDASFAASSSASSAATGAAILKPTAPLSAIETSFLYEVSTKSTTSTAEDTCGGQSLCPNNAQDDGRNTPKFALIELLLSTMVDFGDVFQSARDSLLAYGRHEYVPCAIGMYSALGKGVKMIFAGVKYSVEAQRGRYDDPVATPSPKPQRPTPTKMTGGTPLVTRTPFANISTATPPCRIHGMRVVYEEATLAFHAAGNFVTPLTWTAGRAKLCPQPNPAPNTALKWVALLDGAGH